MNRKRIQVLAKTDQWIHKVLVVKMNNDDIMFDDLVVAGNRVALLKEALTHHNPYHEATIVPLATGTLVVTYQRFTWIYRSGRKCLYDYIFEPKDFELLREFILEDFDVEKYMEENTHEL